MTKDQLKAALDEATHDFNQARQNEHWGICHDKAEMLAWLTRSLILDKHQTEQEKAGVIS